MQRAKLLFSLLMLCLCLSNTAMAQPPQYATVIHPNNLCFPIGSSSTYFKTQFIYFPTDFVVQPPTGNITQIYLSPNNSPTGSITISNLSIKIGMTNLTALPTSSVYVTGLTTALVAATYTIPMTTNNTWTVPIVLQTPVPYTAGQNLIVEIEHTGYTGSAFCLAAFNSGQTTPIRRTIYGPAGSATGGGGFDDWFGDLGIDVSTGPPCPAPTGLNVTNILNKSATVSWSSVPGSLGYQYIVDNNPTVPFPNTPVSTVALTANITGLTPSTIYYLHVRNMCSPTNPSPWVDLKFTTLPPCNNPTGFKVTNLLPNSATISWNPLASALSWDYLVDQSSATPVSSTGSINVLVPTANVPGLTEDTKYYVHIRSNCTGEQSGWSLDSFTTPIPCRAPDIKIDYINTDEAVAYWAPVPTAYQYEYAISTSATPPVQGTIYQFTSIHTSALVDGQTYYIHVRNTCSSIGTVGTSPWATSSFKTFPTSINNANSDKFSIEIYPNPVKDVMTISLTAQPGNNATAILTDVAGKTLRMVEVKGTKTDINVANLAPGNYTLKYADDQHQQVLRINKK